MNTISCGVNGITFRHKDAPRVAKLKPTGKVEIKPEVDNPDDPYALAVYWHGKKLGYIPRDDEQNEYSPQRWVIQQIMQNKPITAEVREYRYFDKKAGWNDDHQGKLQCVKITINNGEKDEGQRLDDKSGYFRDGKRFMSITKFLDQYLPQDFEGLMRWAFKFGSYEKYMAELNTLAAAGDALHAEAEFGLRGEKVTHEGLQNFLAHHKPKLIASEQTVYDEDIQVAGTYDALVEIGGKRIIIDWKSSKAVRDKHRLQVAFYAKNANVDEAWVVALGAKTKQGYSVSKVNIDREYNRIEIMREFSKA